MRRAVGSGGHGCLLLWGLVVSPLPKTASSRRINHLPAFAADVLRQHRVRQLEERLSAGARWQEHDLVFPSTIGTPLEPRNVTRHLHQLCKEAGLPRERFHNLRHTAASIGFAEGLDPKMIQHMLGHSSIGVTMDTYTHLVPGLQKDAAERISMAFREPDAGNESLSLASRGAQVSTARS